MFSPRTQVVEAPPGYMQALVRRIVSNIAVRVHSLIVKYVHDDVILSLNVKHLAVDSVGTNWEPAFAGKLLITKIVTVVYFKFVPLSILIILTNNVTINHRY